MFVNELVPWVRFYRDCGLQAIPCDPFRKKPMIRVSTCWDADANVDWRRFRNANIQVMTGGVWGLVVIDCDGPEAIEKFRRFNCPSSWTVLTPSGGLHVWFRCPIGSTVRHSFLWRGDGKHSGIERLGDRTLVVAPPSRFPGKRPYRWAKNLGPWDREMASAPQFLLAARNKPYSQRPLRELPHGAVVPSLAQMGVRFTGRRRGDWVECYSPIRDEDCPSAAIHATTGYMVDRGGQSMQLWDLVAVLTHCRDWKEARDLHGTSFGLPKFDSSKKRRPRAGCHVQ